LIEKLGIKSGQRILLVNTPENYSNLIGDWPGDVLFENFRSAGELDFIHYFTTEKQQLQSDFPFLKDMLRRGGLIWISWPKGKSLIRKDLNENDVRNIGLQNGLVDVKVCAVDEDWSALKFLFRKK